MVMLTGPKSLLTNSCQTGVQCTVFVLGPAVICPKNKLGKILHFVAGHG